VLVIGLLYCVGTYAAYLAAGLGLYFVVAGSALLPVGRLALYALAAALAVAFALRTLPGAGDADAAGSPVDRKLEHRLVRSLTGSLAPWLAAPLLGAAFAFVELACTGQVYLPVVATLAAGGEWGPALTGLLAYNAAFIAPLAGLTVAMAFGGKALTAPRFAPLARVGRRAVALALVLLSALLLTSVHGAAGVV
jgi:cytochrome c biogenesis protein CcdA